MTNKEFKEKLIKFTYDIEYYLWHKPKDFYYDVKWYFKNRITFNKVLRTWRPWDSAYQVDLFKFGIEQLCDCIENYGNEEHVSKNKKITAMKELIAELSRDIEDETHLKVYGKDYDFGFYFEDDNNGKTHTLHTSKEKENRKLHKLYEIALEKEKNKHYDKIFKLIKGQSYKELKKLQNEALDKLSPEEKLESLQNGNYDVWVSGFDGSGIEGWWD